MTLESEIRNGGRIWLAAAEARDYESGGAVFVISERLWVGVEVVPPKACHNYIRSAPKVGNKTGRGGNHAKRARLREKFVRSKTTSRTNCSRATQQRQRKRNEIETPGR